MGEKRGRDRRRNRKITYRRVLICVFTVLLAVAGLFFFSTFQRKKMIPGESLSDKTHQAVSDIEEAGAKANSAAVLLSAEESKEAKEDFKETKKESKGNFFSESDVNSAEETALQSVPEMEEETTEETERETAEGTSAEASPEVLYLKNLDEYRPGDLIPKEKIDPENLDQYFTVYPISRDGNVFSRINGSSYRDNDNIALSDLRYIQMPHYNFNGNVQLGELIVNRSIADDIVSIFKELFRNGYQIEKMYLIDNYWTGDGEESDTNSIDHNNTSAFCYRTGTGSSSLSRHAFGMAIDINPQQNPYVSYSTGEPKWSHSNANDYIARDTGYAHVITHDDLAYQLFTEHGFTWGGDWTNPKDYQHFEIRSE